MRSIHSQIATRIVLLLRAIRSSGTARGTARSRCRRNLREPQNAPRQRRRRHSAATAWSVGNRFWNKEVAWQRRKSHEDRGPVATRVMASPPAAAMPALPRLDRRRLGQPARLPAESVLCQAAAISP